MRKLYIIQILLLCCLGVMAQKAGKSLTISGIVVDKSSDKEPIIGANIFLKDRPGVGTTTDLDGRFKVQAHKGDVLIVNYIGYDKIEYFVTDSQTNLVLKMTPSATALDEVVVVGMGTQRKVSVVGAITSVDIGDLAVPATSLNNSLGGRVPGVISIQSSGEPGKNISEFWVRGIGTFGANSSALVLIDGLEGDLSQVDPADVESFSVLKDASATAVYGVRGANGVILVTTKRGTVEKLKITARANFTISQLKRLPKYLRAYDYAKLANEARVVSGEKELYSPMEMDLIQYQLDPDLYPDVNWQDEILHKTSFQQTYYVSAQGGGSIARYFVSMGMSKESAAYIQDPDSRYKADTGYNTYNYRTNLDINVTKSTTLYLGLDGFISNKKEPGMANTDLLWNAQSMLTPLTIPTRFSTGQLPAYGVNDAYSPYVMLNHTGMATRETYKNMVTLALNQDLSFLLKGLKVKVQGALNSDVYYDETRFVMPEMYSAIGRTTSGELQLAKKVDAQAATFSKTLNHWRKYHFEFTANYERLFNDKHRTTALLYYYMSDEKATKDITDSMSAIPKRYQGVSGRITYSFKDTYFIDANFGYTGSAQFEKGKRFGFFPSIAVGWVPTSYNWVNEAIPWLSFLKFRGSYGQVGNDQISGDRFPYLTLINDNATSYWGYRERGITETVKGADNLQWEVAKKLNFGIDAKFFHDKLSVTVDFFRDTRDHIFQDRVTLPKFVGMVTVPKSNVGKMHSYGSDGNFEFFHQINKDMSFTVRGNYTFSQNIIDYYEENKLPYDYLSVTGKPFNILRGYIAEGLFSSKEEINTSADQSGFGRIRPGDIKYRDVNGDGIINDDDKVPLSYSNQLPRVMYGFGADFHWKDLTLSFLFKGSAKVDYYRSGLGNDAGWIPFYNGELGNVIKLANNPKNRWTPAWYSGTTATENPHAEFPRLSYGGNTNNSQLSSFWKRNGSFLRLQEVSLRYSLKHLPWIKAVGLSSVDLEFVANNLCTFDNVKYFDPEQASANGAVYPIPATYSFQVYLRF